MLYRVLGWAWDKTQEWEAHFFEKNRDFFIWRIFKFYPFWIDFGLHLGTQQGGDEGGSNALLKDFSALVAKMAPKPLQEGHGDRF